MEESKPDILIIPKDLEDKFIKKGNIKDAINPIGIPVSSRFVKTARDIRKELNLSNDDKIVLIMLGSMGFGNILDLLKQLENENYKIITICGTNTKLLEEIKDKKYKNVIPFGFTKNINDFIYTANVVVSKPGGLSSTEIAAIRKSLIHMFAIPGIETYNMNYFKEHNMSINCSCISEVKDAINKLLNDEELQKELVQNQIKYINNESAKDLVKIIKEKF